MWEICEKILPVGEQWTTKQPPNPQNLLGKKIEEMVENTDVCWTSASVVNTDASYKKKYNAVMESYLDKTFLV